MIFSSVKPLSVLAPAKVNLYLHVTGRRDDGYHLLDSLAVFASCGDRIGLRPSRGFSFTVDGAFARSFVAGELDSSARSRNLAVRAVHGLAALLGRAPDVDLKLTKNLPLAAGLGGGSADAAATVWALLELWGVAAPSVEGLVAAPSVEGLDDFLLSLGADVPACFYCRPVRMTGIGEVCTPAEDAGELSAVLVNPGISCPTAAVFRGLGGVYGDSAPPFTGGDFIGYLARYRNDLTAPATAIVPQIGDVMAALARQKGCRLARMSGSGATCFALFADEMQALDAAGEIARNHPRWWVRTTNLGRVARY